MIAGIFGDITTPFGNPNSPNFTDKYADVTTGLPLFVSNVVRLVTIAGGLWMFMNLLVAGFMYLSASGSQEQITKAWNMIWQSMVGLLIIVIAFVITAVISLLLFGKAETLLQPVIYGPGTL